MATDRNEHCPSTRFSMGSAVVISNTQKAAALLQNLPDEEATTLRAQLSSGQQARLIEATATASILNDEQQLALCGEFLQLTEEEPQRSLPKTDAPKSPRPSSNQNENNAALPEDLLFQFFYQLTAQTMFGLLQQETPQTIAAVLSHLPTRQAATVLNQFEPELQVTIVDQISRQQPVALQALIVIAEVLQSRLEELQNQQSLLAEM